MQTTLINAALSYLLGSIPFGYLLVRIFRGEDVRQSGSGNIGATNVSRKSPALGVVTLLLDALKGSAAVVVAIIPVSPEIVAVEPPVHRSSVNSISVRGAMALPPPRCSRFLATCFRCG